MAEGEGMSLRLLAFACAAAALASPALAEQRTFSVTDFSKVRVDGPYRVKLTTGVAPFARATGAIAALDGVDIEVQGQTLIIRKNSSSWGGYPGQSPGPVEIVVGTHDLFAVWLNGPGALAIDRAKAQSFDLAIEGSGSVAIGHLQADTFRVGISGTGSSVVGGSAAQVKAIVRGTSTFDGSALTAKDATIGAEGAAVVKLNATNTAKIDTQGTSMVEITGDPACTVRASGSAEVSGCR
jgi:hypothetical protein